MVIFNSYVSLPEGHQSLDSRVPHFRWTPKSCSTCRTNACRTSSLANQKEMNFPRNIREGNGKPNWLVVWTPLKNMTLSAGIMKFPTEWKVIIQMFQTTKQQTSFSFISFSVHPIPGQKLTQKSSTNFGPIGQIKVSHDRAYVPTQL